MSAEKMDKKMTSPVIMDKMMAELPNIYHLESKLRSTQKC